MEIKPIVENCIGCSKINGDFCKTYAFPESKWAIGNCPMATHLVREKKQEIKVNPLKHSKRRGK